ncbi:MAG: GPW/gp25 family protein [Chitinophagaceae bacterium]|nr:GPW/gp25 family protein [Chitinophagaceae bacterium]
MSSGFLSLPLQLDLVPQRGILQLCQTKQSIAHHIHLILTTSLGELASDEAFGCGLWDADFDNLSSRSRLKDGLVQALDDAIRSHEPRLEQVRTDLQLQQEELSVPGSNRRIKNRLDITITGIMKGTNEPIIYKDHFFISPLSYN